MYPSNWAAITNKTLVTLVSFSNLPYASLSIRIDNSSTDPLAVLNKIIANPPTPYSVFQNVECKTST